MQSDHGEDGPTSSHPSDLMRLKPGEVIELGDLPDGPYDLFSPVTRKVVLTYANFATHLDRHPEMLTLLEHIPSAVLNPQEVFVTERNPRTANAVREVVQGVFIVVSVWISTDSKLANSAHSFRRYGERTMRKVRAKHRMLWNALK